MIRCLCCGKEIKAPAPYEEETHWHRKCIRSFFGTDRLPDIDCSEKALEMLAEDAVNRGLTVPGVQKKLSLHLEECGRESRLTIMDHPSGYILKPQSSEYEQLPEAEFLVMKMAEAVKIKTVPNAMIMMNGNYAYITARIDRRDGKKLAMEDFCQLSQRLTEAKYHSSYENCGKVIRKYSENVGLDTAEFYYRLLFCFLTGNSDMHLKNFSLIESEPESRTFSLSAAYDLLPVNLIVPQDQEQMALTLHGKKRNIKKKDFLCLAETIGLSPKAASGLIGEILKNKEKLIELTEQSYLSETMKEGMKEIIETRANALS